MQSLLRDRTIMVFLFMLLATLVLASGQTQSCSSDGQDGEQATTCSSSFDKEHAKKSKREFQDDNTDQLDHLNSCRDLHDHCPVWEQASKCVLDPEYMQAVCPESCWKCVNVTKLQEEGLSMYEIQHRLEFSKQNWGMIQTYDPSSLYDQQVVLPVLKSMEEYAIQLIGEIVWDELNYDENGFQPTTTTKTMLAHCQNQQPDCVIRAARRECFDISDDSKPWDFCMIQCPLACQVCEQIVPFQESIPRHSQRGQPWIRPLHQIPTRILERRKQQHSSSLSSTLLDAQNVTLHSVNKQDKYMAWTSIEEWRRISSNNTTPWVLQLDYSSYLQPQEWDTLLEWLEHHVEWQPSSAFDYATTDFTQLRSRQFPRRTTSSHHCHLFSRHQQEQYQPFDDVDYACPESMDSIIGAILEHLLLNDSDDESHFNNIEDLHRVFNYLEPIEIVKVEPGQSFGAHSDYRFHDTWNVPGPRVLTVFVKLSDTTTAAAAVNESTSNAAWGEGGAMGFPDLDWTIIPLDRPGQVLVWPNVKSSNPMQQDEALSSEQLPTLPQTTTQYGFYLWIRLFQYVDDQCM